MKDQVWIHVITTGDRPAYDSILELGVLIFEEDATHQSTWLVNPWYGKMNPVARMAPSQREHLTKNGLLEAVDRAHENNALPDPWDVAESVAKFITDHVTPPVPLMGPRATRTRRFLEAQMPPLLTLFDDTTLDLTSMAHYRQIKHQDQNFPKDFDMVGRALADINAAVGATLPAT